MRVASFFRLVRKFVCSGCRFRHRAFEEFLDFSPLVAKAKQPKRSNERKKKHILRIIINERLLNNSMTNEHAIIDAESAFDTDATNLQR